MLRADAFLYSMIDGLREPCESTNGNVWNHVSPPGNQASNKKTSLNQQYRKKPVY